MTLSYRQIIKTWWPLAFSWLLMSVEIPMLGAVIARLEHPEINLAAYGGVVYPLSLIIEAPIIMLLAASVAICKNRQAYGLVRRYMMTAGLLLTCLHALVAFTPLYYVVVEDLIGAPHVIVEPARIGLMLVLPWTWAIAYRRFNQGVLIRFGYSGAVGTGTIVRLVTDVVVLALGYFSHRLPGIAVAAGAQALGVVSEAVYSGVRVQPVLRRELAQAPESAPLTLKGFGDFYIPLALTSLITLLWQPVGSAALSRMPGALASLAAWPVVTGLVSLLRSGGTAYNEAVVALLDREQAWQKLRRFSTGMAGILVALHLLFAVTPLSELYFARFSALPDNLVQIAQTAFIFALPMPALAVYQSWFQGMILHGGRTRGVTESVMLFFAGALVVLVAGVATRQWTGLYVGITAFVLATFAQVVWLWLRSRPVMAKLSERYPTVNTELT